MKAGRNFAIWLVIIVVMSFLMGGFSDGARRASASNLAFSDFMNEVEAKRVSEVTIAGSNVTGELTDGRRFYSYTPYDPTMVETLRKSGVVVKAEPEDTTANTFWGIDFVVSDDFVNRGLGLFYETS